MNIPAEELEKIKQSHPDGVYEGVISFTDEEDHLHEVEFLYRKPVTADIEAHTKSMQRNPIVANLNLVQSLVLWPDPASVVERIGSFPAAFGQFIDQAVAPFFGANVSVRHRKI